MVIKVFFWENMGRSLNGNQSWTSFIVATLLGLTVIFGLKIKLTPLSFRRPKVYKQSWPLLRSTRAFRILSRPKLEENG